MSGKSRRGKFAVVGVVAALAGAGGIYYYMTTNSCAANKEYGLRQASCPEGKPIQIVTLNALNISRHQAGRVAIDVKALFTTGRSDSEQEVGITDYKVALQLVDGDKQTELIPQAKLLVDRTAGKKGSWENAGRSRSAQIVLPKVDDGDYLLRAVVTSKLGETEALLPIGVYAPSTIHVLTDRPLYEPGNVVQFRALALRASDLAPIDNRPGRWMVRDPSGQVLLEEKAPAKDWGVVAGSFPLDSEAELGQWSVSWQSGGESGQSTFTVEPFTLPRFRVEAETDKPFYGAGDQPVLSGAVIYSSGAPVIGANIEVSWAVSGEWPPPSSWLNTALPKLIAVDRNGRFSVTLPAVPADLRKKAQLSARLSVIDPGGDRVVGSASVQLSEDPISVEAVTELADGLVRGSNNRVYLRVTSASGTPITNRELRVTRAWQPADPGIVAELDENGVARLQIDPGPAVNMIIPPMPVRQHSGAAGPLVSRRAATDLVSSKAASLADRAAMDQWTKPLEACAKWTLSGTVSRVALRVSANGKISSAVGGSDELSQCTARLLGSRSLPSSRDRLYRVEFYFQDPKLPTLTASTQGSFGTPAGLPQLFQTAATDARTCIDKVRDGAVPYGLAWQVRKGQRSVTASWVRLSSADQGGAQTDDRGFDSSVRSCVLAAASTRQLPTPSPIDDLGVVRFNVSVPAERKIVKPQPTIMKGYELRVETELGAGIRGQTVVRITPGTIPDVRLRATPVIAHAGDFIEVALLRGPEFTGKVPEKLGVGHLGKRELIDLDPKTRIARFEVPAEGSGWYEFTGLGRSAKVFVQSKSALAVTITAEKLSYRPGDSATINIETTIGGQGSQAAVGLFGVDKSLGQIATMAGPDELIAVQPTIQMTERAFGVLDGQALALGRIAGSNAAEATVLKVARLPSPRSVDNPVGGTASTTFDVVAVLADRFYPILAALHTEVREWERSAAKDAAMEPVVMAGLWKKALKRVEASGGSVVDAYGRRMRLHHLPADLLELTAARQVVMDGTRLSEDVENWSEWVAENRP